MSNEKRPDKARFLILLVIIFIFQLGCRNLPIYLSTVPVPGCEQACRGVHSVPLCHAEHVWEEGKPVKPAEVPQQEACLRCKAGKPLAFGGDAKKLASKLPDPYLIKAPTFFQVNARVDHVERLERSVSIHKDHNATYYNLVEGVCVSHRHYGVIAGYCFGIPFGIALLVAVRLCYYQPRIFLIGFSMLVCSITIGVQAGAEEDDWTLLVAMRAVEGVAEAFLLAATLSLTADVFSDGRERTMVLMVLNTGVWVGAGCASMSIWLAMVVGWRWVDMFMCLAGLLITAAWLALAVEPQRIEQASALVEFMGVFAEVSKARLARLLIAAASAKALSALSLATFMPLWISRAGLTGFTAARYAGLNAVVIITGSLGGVVIGAFATYAWFRRHENPYGAVGWIGLAGSVLAIPLLCLILLAGSFAQAMISYFLLLLTDCWYGPTVLAFQASVRKSVSWQAVAMFHTVMVIVASTGPAILGVLDDGSAALHGRMLFLCICANIIAGGAFWLASEEIRVDPPHPHTDDELEQVCKPTLVM